MIPMNKWKSWILVLLLSSLLSCNQNRVYEEYIGLKSLQWTMNDTISFEIDSKLIADKNIIAVKYNTSYPYRNLYLRYILKDSVQKVVKSELVNIALFESASGQPLGKGYGSTFTKYDTLPLKDKTVFSSIQFIQFMRVDKLDGIEAIGLKGIKGK
jgi:gliding motility-associated lipoprotein GldH